MLQFICWQIYFISLKKFIKLPLTSDQHLKNVSETWYSLDLLLDNCQLSGVMIHLEVDNFLWKIELKMKTLHYEKVWIRFQLGLKRIFLSINWIILNDLFHENAHNYLKIFSLPKIKKLNVSGIKVMKTLSCIFFFIFIIF